jgi:nicotinate-nucleotide adenylyltransferase
VAKRFSLPPHDPGARIGLFGGSFDPTHRGHVRASETARHRLGLDRVWWLVTPGNPLKSAAPSDIAARIAEARALTRGRRISVTGIEAEIGSRFTADTILWLRGRLRSVSLVWIMGADNLAGFHHWQHWRRIAEAVPMAVVDRPGSTIAALKSPAARQLGRFRLPERLASTLPEMAVPAWVFLHGPRIALSSTEIRKRRSGGGVS